jgi:hypothetical protein
MSQKEFKGKQIHSSEKVSKNHSFSLNNHHRKKNNKINKFSFAFKLKGYNK